MDDVYRLLLKLGYPEKGIDFLRRFRGATIAVLAAIAWLMVVLIVTGAIYVASLLS